jgi:hypothetical protein
MSGDFDWVNARAACSLSVVFKELEFGARHDIDAIKVKRPDAEGEFKVVLDDGQRHFAVIRERRTRTDSVNFTLEDTQIIVKNPGPGGVSFIATLTLNDNGECRLKVNGKELEQWQVRRKALEDLLFGPKT